MSRKLLHCKASLPIADCCPECQAARREYKREYSKTSKQSEYQHERSKTPKRREYQREYYLKRKAERAKQEEHHV